MQLIRPYLHFITLAIIFFFSASFSQILYGQKWEKLKDNNNQRFSSDKKFWPAKYDTYKISYTEIKKLLSGAPNRSEKNVLSTTIAIPNEIGDICSYYIYRSDVFSPGLAAKYPGYEAYTGYSIDNPGNTIKITINPGGMEAMILSQDGTFYIDQYSKKDKNTYIFYNKKDYHRPDEAAGFSCKVEIPDDGYHPTNNNKRTGDCMLRKYKLALACTGEYANYHGGTVQSVLAAYNAAMNRVNGVYEKDFGITMELIPNTDLLIYLNGTTDPYTNNDGGAMLSENQSNIDNVIGFNNYDIGHVFSTGGGGIASLRAPCTNRKARGVTGSGNPTGDPFWIDYVAHEMGHQFGGNHTFNNSCGNNINPSTAIEPGSGTTIMGYAGICPPDIQNHSDDYFHGINILEVIDFVVAGNGGCAQIIPIENHVPEITSVPQSGLVLPSRTPFMLHAEAIDEDGDVLTYCWEQIDNESASMPPSQNSTQGPAFRSFVPSTSGTRFFPSLSRILSGANTDTWEVLPNANRDMNFSVTVRDNHAGLGCTEIDYVSLQFVKSAGPFRVSSQNNFSTWNAGSEETITWDVAGTDQAPIMCENVDILLSTDGGQNFDIVLADDTPNDGEQTITVPFELSDNCRIMVKCSSSIFFDINNRFIVINAPFQITPNINAQVYCPDIDNTISYDLDFTYFVNNGMPVSLGTSDLPSGIDAEFSDNDLTTDSQVTLTLSNVENVTPGDYQFFVTATDGTLTQEIPLQLIIAPETLAPIMPVSPSNGQTNVESPVIGWTPIDGVEGYTLEISETPAMVPSSTIVLNTQNTYDFADAQANTVYYWRVKPISICLSETQYSEVFSFQTKVENCQITNTDQDVIIPANIESEITSSVQVENWSSTSGNTILVAIDIMHSWIGDLSATLTSPSGTEITLFERPGYTGGNSYGCENDDIQVIFSNSAVMTNDDFYNSCENSPPAISGEFQPKDSFDAFEGEDLEGEWVLTITDAVGEDGGKLDSWSIKICGESQPNDGVILQNNTLELVNTLDGIISSSHLEMQNTNSENTIFTIRKLPQNGEVILDGPGLLPTALSIGDVFTQQDINDQKVHFSATDISQENDFFIFDALDNNYGYLANLIFNVHLSTTDLVVSTTVDSVTCYGGSDGAIHLDVSGGIAPITFSLNAGDFVSEPDFEGLQAGVYTIVAKSGDGSETTIGPIQVYQPEELVGELAYTDGAISITGTGGTPPLSYSDDGQSYQEENQFEIQSDIPVTYFIKDAKGCIWSETKTFSLIKGIDFTAINVDCKGNANGTILVNTVNGGTPPYVYTLGTTSNEDGNFENLPPGDYTIVISDSDGITFESENITITEPDASLSVQINTTNTSIEIMASGGTPPYMYSIDGGESFTNSANFEGLEGGNYTVVVTDQNNCSEMIEEVLITATGELPESKIILYPNPATTSIFIEGLKDNTSYTIIDPRGKSIKKGLLDRSSARIDIRDFTPGIYLIKLKNTKTSSLHKIFIN